MSDAAAHTLESLMTDPCFVCKHISGACALCLREKSFCQPACAVLVQLNFLSSQTKQDILISCNCVILAIMIFAKLAAQGHFVKFAPGRMSSRFVEYVFQALRAATRTSAVFTILGAMRLVRNYAAQLELEALTDLPQVCRKLPGWHSFFSEQLQMLLECYAQAS